MGLPSHGRRDVHTCTHFQRQANTHGCWLVCACTWDPTWKLGTCILLHARESPGMLTLMSTSPQVPSHAPQSLSSRGREELTAPSPSLAALNTACTPRKGAVQLPSSSLESSSPHTASPSHRPRRLMQPSLLSQSPGRSFARQEPPSLLSSPWQMPQSLGPQLRWQDSAILYEHFIPAHYTT